MENALPYDATAEDAVLGSVITNPGEYEAAARYFTDSSVFYQRRARLLWSRIKQMVRDKQTLDTLTVCMSVTQDDIN